MENDFLKVELIKLKRKVLELEALDESTFCQDCGINLLKHFELPVPL